MIRDDTEPTNRTDDESPRRTDVLDDMQGRERGGLADAAGRTAESNGSTASRRSVLAIAGAIGATALSGCLGPLTGPATFEASPVVKGLPPLRKRLDAMDETGLVHAMLPATRVTARGTVEKYGVSKQVETDNWGSSYMIWTRECPGHDMPIGMPCPLIAPPAPHEELATLLKKQDGDPAPVGGVDIVASPKIDIADRTFNPIDELTPRDVVRTLRQTGEMPGADKRIVEHEIDGFQRPGPLLEALYAGPIRAVSNVRITDNGGPSFDAKQPIVFGANVKLDGSDEQFPVTGTLERIEYDGNYALKAAWTVVDKDDIGIGCGLYSSTAPTSGNLVTKNGMIIVDSARLCTSRPQWHTNDALAHCISNCPPEWTYDGLRCRRCCEQKWGHDHTHGLDCKAYAYLKAPMDSNDNTFGDFVSYQMKPQPSSL